MADHPNSSPSSLITSNLALPPCYDPTPPMWPPQLPRYSFSAPQEHVFILAQDMPEYSPGLVLKSTNFLPTETKARLGRPLEVKSTPAKLAGQLSGAFLCLFSSCNCALQVWFLHLKNKGIGAQYQSHIRIARGSFGKKYFSSASTPTNQITNRGGAWASPSSNLQPRLRTSQLPQGR